MAYIKEDEQPEGEQQGGPSAMDTEPAGGSVAVAEDGATLQLPGKEEQAVPADAPTTAEDAAHQHHATAAVAGTSRITFLYRLQEGAADASFGGWLIALGALFHCSSSCMLCCHRLACGVALHRLDDTE